MNEIGTMSPGIDLTVELGHPFALALAVRALTQAEVPIVGCCVLPERHTLHVAVSREDALIARRKLEAEDLKVTGERNVVLMDLPRDAQGWFDRFRRMANDSLRVDLLYMGTSNRLVIGIEKGSAVFVELLAEMQAEKTFTFMDSYDRRVLSASA